MSSAMLEKFIFYPRENHSVLTRIWKDSEVVFSLNEQILRGWVMKNKSVEKGPFIIYYGGNAEDVSLNLYHYGKINAESILLMNYRGYGTSTGKPTKKDLLQDALAIFDEVIKKQMIEPSNIILMGRSLGSSIAAYVASQRKVGGLILITPFDSIQNLVKKLIRWLPLGYFFKNSFDTRKYLAGVNCKILVLSAEHDEVIPKECLQPLLEEYQSQITLATIVDADHQDIAEYDDYYTEINKYLKNGIL